MSADYKNYLLAKNKVSQKNLNVYKAKYETSTGKITPEEGQQMLELNDNIVDKEQISNELRDQMRKYVPNLQYLDQVLNDHRLTDQMKYDLYLNFNTYVEPKLNAIRNRKISIEKFIAFLIKLGKDLAQSDLTQNINDNVNKLTNVFRPQINDYEADQAGLSQQELANTLVAYNIKELEDLGIEESSADGRKTEEIKILIRQLMFIDKLVYNFERAKNLSPTDRNIETKAFQIINSVKNVVEYYSKLGKKIAVWGAGHRALALMAMANLVEIDAIVDSADFKQGKYSPILHKKIISPDVFFNSDYDVLVLMLPGAFNDQVASLIKDKELTCKVILFNDVEISPI
jgi:hypothetical protein